MASISRLFGAAGPALLRRSDAKLRAGLAAPPKAAAAGLSGTSTVTRSEGGGYLRELVVTQSTARSGRSMQERRLRLESAVEVCPDPSPGQSHGKAKLAGVAVYDVVTRVAVGRKVITTTTVLRLSLAAMPALVTRRAKFDGVLGPADRLTMTTSQSVSGPGGTHDSPTSTFGMSLDSMSPGTEVTFDNAGFDAFVARSEARDNGDPNPYADSPTAGAAYKGLARAFADMVGARVTALVKDAEKLWQTPGRCVKLTLTGDPSRLRPGATSHVSGAVTATRPGVSETDLLDGGASFDGDYIDPRGTAVTVATLPLKPGMRWYDFTAPAAAWPRTAAPGLDITFYSKGGIGRATVTYPAGFPERFVGTWTRVLTGLFVGTGWKETIQGTATFTRNPILGVSEGLIPVPYDFAGGSVTWSVSGSGGGGSCTTTYSGSGNDAVSPPSATEETGFTLEDVSAKGATSTPFHYSIRASGDPLMPPLFTITTTGGAGCAATSQEHIAVNFLNVGVIGDPGPDTPPELVETSGDVTLLEGHRVRSDPGVLATDDTWSFKGSD
ncbi:MAG TPA: hypothetical protein VII98_11690 [Solirubrobacteraceae bacterium]